MQHKTRFPTIAGGVAAFFVLANCATVDKFSSRAVEYNLQAEQAQQQALLLNIIRASLRRPMQFTSLQSITGTASASGSITGGYSNTHQTPYLNQFGIAPLGSNPVVSGIATATGTPTASMSGGPTFTVPVLDTQEFYQGILSPVSPQIIDYYVHQGFPPELLFDVFVSSVEVIATDDPACEQFTFQNSVRNNLQFSQFHALADYLLSSGFTTERINEPFGPQIAPARGPLSAGDAAKTVEAYSKAAEAGLDIGTEAHGYRLQKKTNRYRTCFTFQGRHKPSWLGATDDDIYCGHFSARQMSVKMGPRCSLLGGEQGVPEEGSSHFHGVKIADVVLERIGRLQEAASASGTAADEDFFSIKRFRNQHVTFRIHTRSVEGILYYLGEITRQHLNPEFGEPRITQVKTSLRYGSLPPADCEATENGGAYQKKTDLIKLVDGAQPDDRPYYCENFFVLDTGPNVGSFFSVEYDGNTYSIPADPSRAGRTLQVLELVKQLLALNTSAKQLPSTTVISIVSGTPQ
jgi:hypothetical protein